MEQINISKPVQCHLWDALPTKEVLFDSLDTIKTYRDDYHNARKLLKCKACGQLYFSEYYEEVDFSEGEDRQYYVLIPIDNVASADQLSDVSHFALTGYTGIFMYSPPYHLMPYWKNR